MMDNISSALEVVARCNLFDSYCIGAPMARLVKHTGSNFQTVHTLPNTPYQTHLTKHTLPNKHPNWPHLTKYTLQVQTSKLAITKHTGSESHTLPNTQAHTLPNTQAQRATPYQTHRLREPHLTKHTGSESHTLPNTQAQRETPYQTHRLRHPYRSVLVYV